MSSENENLEKLEKNIIRQVEFYFSDYNLHCDKFMQEEMAKNDGWFTMDTMLQFKRLSSLCSEPGTILAALKKSNSNLMDIDIENQQIRRKPGKPVPENNEKYRRDLKLRTVYVKGFPQTESIEDITEFLEDYGKVDGIRLRKFNNPHTGSAFKGSLFATFNKLEDATKFLQAPMVYYKDKELEKKSKEEFWKEKEQESNERSAQRKKNAEKRKLNPGNGNPADEYSFVHVTNLVDQTLNHIDMKEFLRDLGVKDCKFFSRYEKNGPTGYIMFDEKEDAANMLALLKDHYDSNAAMIKDTSVTFEAVTPEQRQTALECYYDFRGLNKQGKKKGGRMEQKRQERKKRQVFVFDDDGNAIPIKQGKYGDAKANQAS